MFQKSFLSLLARRSIIISLFVIGLTVSCKPSTPTPTSTPTITTQPSVESPDDPTKTPTKRPTATPTLPPIGNPGNPITIGFMLTPEQTNAIEAAEDLAFLIEEDTGFSIEYLIYPDFQSLSSAVIDGDVDLYWLAPLEYLYLNEQGAAQAVLMTNHLGVYAYGVQFMANSMRGFTPYYDPEKSLSLGDSITSLQQFSGTRPCFISPDSIPGYLVPSGFLSNASTPTLDPVFTYSYTAMVRALFIQGICDFGVSYALIGDPRNASDIIQTIPDVQSQVIVIWQSEGVIPNINLSASPELPLNIRYQLQEAFLDLPNTPEGLTLVSTALNYDVEAFKTVEDGFYDPLRSALIPLNLDLNTVTQP
ncbi:MAG: PhnD/SsuA/transferrin family substrate-binding protein [Chloroflexota bacterium]|nr:PhnD/SsuA/transferrin family substrate-binding protein [Chloroflexota bacterium]